MVTINASGPPPGQGVGTKGGGGSILTSSSVDSIAISGGSYIGDNLSSTGGEEVGLIRALKENNINVHITDKTRVTGDEGIYIYIYRHMDRYIQIYINILMYIYISICLYIDIHTHIFLYI
jgi:hypothetical protein